MRADTESARYRRTGALSAAESARLGQIPGLTRLRSGPVVAIECVEEIPCNPCVYGCPRKAITIEGGLTGLPKVDFEKCNGCTLCIARCPGLAIFVIAYNHSKTEAAVTLPYELLPRPQKGEKVAALDRLGRRVGTGTVIRVLDAKPLDRCAVVTVAVPKRLWNVVRSIRVKGKRRRESEAGNQKSELRSRRDAKIRRCKEDGDRAGRQKDKSRKAERRRNGRA